MPSTITPNNAADIAEDYRQSQIDREERKHAHDQEMNRLDRNYQTEIHDQKDRFDHSVQGEKLQHYENLRNLKHQMTKDEIALREQGRKRNENVTDELAKATNTEENKFRNQVSNLQTTHNIQLEQDNKLNQEQIDGLHKTYTTQQRILTEDNQRVYDQMQRAKHEELDKQMALTAMANDQTVKHFESERADTTSHFAQQFDEIQNLTQDSLHQLRTENALKLGSYESRLTDPFYRLVRVDAEVTETSDEVRIRVKVPPHERENVRLQISGNNAQVTGVRSNSERVETSPGHWVSTSSQQSFSERVTLPAPVDGHSLHVETEGDDLVYVMNKLTTHVHPQFQSTQHASDRKPATQPDFPLNLPKPVLARETGRNGPIDEKN